MPDDTASNGGDEETRTWTQTVLASQYDRLRAVYPSAYSDPERGRMALEDAIRMRERGLAPAGESCVAVVERLDELLDALDDRDCE